MKKTLFLLFSFLITINVFAQTTFIQNKICEFENRREQGFLIMRPISEIDPYENDLTGNELIIDESGKFYFIQYDRCKLYQFDFFQKKLLFIRDLDFIDFINEGISKITDKYYFCHGAYGRFQLLDKNFNLKFKINMLDCKMRVNTKEAYYIESTNILFFRDSNEALHCIVHPGMNDEENQKNYKNPEQTLELFENEVTINGTSIRVTKRGSLFVNGNYTYWGQLPVGDYVYQINRDDVFCYDQETAENTFNVIISDDSEEIESIAIHPSGDIYVLRMNWQTNTHNLYYIENTWDPEWREQWYKEHPDAAKPEKNNI